MLNVFGLGQTVCIEEYCGVRVNHGLLDAELPSGHDSDRKVGIDGKHSGTCVSYQHGCVMTGVGVMKPSGGKIQRTDEQGYEHVRFVVLGHGVHKE